MLSRARYDNSSLKVGKVQKLSKSLETTFPPRIKVSHSIGIVFYRIYDRE